MLNSDNWPPGLHALFLPSVFLAIVVITADPSHDKVVATLEVHGTIKVVDVAGPVTLTEAHSCSAFHSEAAILFTVVVIA